jgi:hypothetical protein
MFGAATKGAVEKRGAVLKKNDIIISIPSSESGYMHFHEEQQLNTTRSLMSVTLSTLLMTLLSMTRAYYRSIHLFPIGAI